MAVAPPPALAARVPLHRPADPMPGQAELSWVTDLNGAVTHYNNPARSYLGLTPPDELGWVWWWAIHPVDLPRVRRSVQWAMQQGRPCQVTYRLRRADGQYRPHRSRVIPVLDERGRVGSWRWTAVAGDDPGR